MFSKYLKTLSILKKFLFINFVIFTIIGLFTLIYLNNIEPSLLKKKSEDHINIINNTTDNIKRLNIKFEENDIRKFLFSTRFIFQNLDRVIFFDNKLNLIGDTDTLDLDPRSFSTRLDKIEFENLSDEVSEDENKENNSSQNNETKALFKDLLENYYNSDDYGNYYTFTQDNLNQFKVTTVKNVKSDENNLGFIVISENANEIKTAIDERRAFVIRTAISVGFVILIFSFVLSRYFIKPIQNLVGYTIKVKEKNAGKTGIENLKNRNDELGLLSSSMEDMTNELQKRISHAENFSTDLVHEIRNPLASLKSASEILKDTKDINQRTKLLDILTHDVQRIERLITDYSQILKDEVALSNEKFKKIDLIPIIQSVVEDYNNLYQTKRGINISFLNDGNKSHFINGIENRIEQIVANLLDNAISFTENNQNIYVKISKNSKKQIVINILDEGPGFKEKDTSKIFKRFYSNRPDKFGQHSGLGLNIVKNLVDLHNATIKASNRKDHEGASVEIMFPKV